MKKILTLAIIAILAANFASATTLSGGKSVKAHTTKSNVKYTKISAKEFSVKKMQDTKDILMPCTPKTVDNSTAKG